MRCGCGSMIGCAAWCGTVTEPTCWQARCPGSAAAPSGSPPWSTCGETISRCAPMHYYTQLLGTGVHLIFLLFTGISVIKSSCLWRSRILGDDEKEEGLWFEGPQRELCPCKCCLESHLLVWSLSCPLCLQLFYKTHILGFLGFMLFGFMHHVSLWAYTMPGQHVSLLLTSRKQ